jgi:hypothetical protein
MLVGLLSIALSLAVGAIAAVNTAIASYHSLHPNPEKFGNTEDEPQMLMQNRVFLCMLIQFEAFSASGLSLILFTSRLHWPFTVVASFLGLVAFIVSAYHLYVFFEWRWAGHVKWYHAISAIFSISALAFDIVTPSRTTWFTLAAFGTTLAAHMIFTLYQHVAKDLSTHENRPQFLAMACAFLIAMVWAGCAVSTIIMGASSTGWARINTYIVCGLCGAEAVLLIGVGIKDAVSLTRKNLNNA